MWIRHAYATAASRRRIGRGSRVVVFGVASLILAGCSGAADRPSGTMASVLGGTAPPPAAAAAAPPRTVQPFDEAVASLTDALLAKADLPPSGDRTLVIDPLIDRATDAQTVTTRSTGAGIERRVRENHPLFQLRPFSVASLDEQPLIILGSIASVTAPGSTVAATGQPHVYRIWAVLADLRTNRVLDREMVWVRADDVDQTPTTFFRESPAWSPDPAVAAYIKTCSSPAGTPIDPAYLQALRAQATIADGVAAYDAGRYQEALDRYSEALRMPGGEQLRALNGIYLADQALGRRREAEAAFAQVVDFGLARGQLAVKLLFLPGSTQFWPDPAVSGPYPMWLRQIAAGADGRGACLSVNGHTSTTGPAAFNVQLSLARAERVRARLVADRQTLRSRTWAKGFGARQPIVGTGADNATDALDRRVEFKPLPCRTASATSVAATAGAS